MQKWKGAAWLERGKVDCETTETFCVIALSRLGDPLSVPLSATESGVPCRLVNWWPQHAPTREAETLIGMYE